MAEIVVLDLGNSVCKTNKGISFDTRISNVDENSVEFSDSIIFDNKCYAIGQGEYEHNNIKSDKVYLEQFVMYGVGCSTKENNIILMLNLPINQLSMKNELIQRLQGKTYKYSMNSSSYNISFKDREIKIEKVAVIAESVASYYSLQDDVNDFVMLLDIGSKTINYATYTQIGQLDMDKSDTIDFGLHDFYESLIKYYKREFHKTYTISDINKRVVSEKIDIPEHLKVEFIEKIKNSLRGHNFFDYNDYSIKCVGGGSVVLKDTLEKSFNDIKVLDEAPFRNVKGTEMIAQALGLYENSNQSI